jgi:hypothetical protein
MGNKLAKSDIDDNISNEKSENKYSYLNPFGYFCDKGNHSSQKSNFKSTVPMNFYKSRSDNKFSENKFLSQSKNMA